MIDTSTLNDKSDTSIMWDSSVERKDQHKNNSESEAENEWTDIVVTKQGDVHTKTRKIQDDLEEPNWDKRVDDVVWEDGDELSWKTNNPTKSKSSINDLTKMKDWEKLYGTEHEDKEKKSKIDKKKNPRRHLFGLDIDDDNHEWHFASHLISRRSHMQTIFYSILILALAYYTKAPIPVTKKQNATVMTISPITTLTKSHPSVALIPKYQNHHNELIIKHHDHHQLTNIPLLTRDIGHLKHPSFISDCATEIYSTDSYLFIASCTFGILIYRI